MEKIINCCAPLTEAEIRDLKRITGQAQTKKAIIDAVEYRIMNADKAKVKK